MSHPACFRAAVAACLVVSALVPSAARACSVCGCGDPLSVANDAMPVLGHFHFALDAEYLTATAASDDAPAATEALTQYTLRPSVVFSALDTLNLVVQAPLVRKDWSLSGEGEPQAVESVALGDLDLGARWFVWQTVDFQSRTRQYLGVSAGTSLPTGPYDVRDEAGERLDDHAQPGTGAFSPYAGVLYAFRRDPWNLAIDLSARTHSENSFQYRYGDAVLWSVQGQLRPWERVAFGLGVDGRWAARDTHAGELQANTGGLLLTAVPGLAINLTGELWLHVRAQLPFYAHLFGTQTVGPVVTASLQYYL